MLVPDASALDLKRCAPNTTPKKPACFKDKMDVPISEMRDFVGGGFDDDLGNVINLTDLGEDLGSSLLSNKPTPASQSASKSVSFDIGSGGGTGGGIEILEPLDAINLDINLGPSDSFGFGSKPSAAPAISIQRDEPGTSSWFGSSGAAAAPAPAMATDTTNTFGETSYHSTVDPSVEKKEKGDYINKLNRLEQKGFPVSRRFTMDNSLDEIKDEYNRLVDARQLETSLKFQRQMVMGLVTGIELLNEKFDPFDLQLKGWSESVHENIDDMDDIFEELYDKYKGKGSMPPEARLMMALAGSGFMFHLSNSMFRKNMPSMDDIFRQNPGLQRQFAAAAAQQMGGQGFGNLMGAAVNAPMPPGPEFFAQPPSPPTASMPPTGMFYGASSSAPQMMSAQEPPKAPRREMKGPSGVDDILKTFEQARQQESEPMFNPFGGGASPSGNVMMTGTADIQQPAVAAIHEIQSIVSEDIGSMAESRRGGGRRRKAQPIGNTVSLNI